MSTNPTPSDTAPAAGPDRQLWAYGLIAAAVLLAVVPVWMIYKYHWEYASVAAWGGALALIFLAAGLGLLFRPPSVVEGVDTTRGLVLLTGGMGGLLTWVLSLALAWKWRATIFGGLEAWQGENWWHLWVCALAMFGGLAVMFVSLMTVRSEQHANVAMRRLLYGYNAVLTGLLVLAILAVVNVLVYNYFTSSFDWTESSIYTLSDKARNILRSLEKPTKVVALIPRSDDLAYREIHTLLDNCRSVNDKVEVEYVSPDIDIARVRELSRQYQILEREGMLVVYGPEGQAEHQFIKYNDIFANDPDARSANKARFIFKGEDALMSALNTLEEGKSKPVIYFTQGSGELDITDSSVGPDEKGAGSLRDRLEKANYTVKGLRFSPVANVKSDNPTVAVSNRVPDDAGLVIVAGPQSPLPDYELKALRDFMNPTDPARKKGKMVVLLGPVLDPARNLVTTGMEHFVSEFNVQVGNDRVLSLPTNLNRGDPVKVAAFANPRANNPITQAFGRTPITLPDVRSVEARNNPPPGGPPMSRLNAEALLVAPGEISWAETNLRADPAQLASDENALENKLKPGTISIAVGVQESAAPPSDDPHAFMRPQDQKPRLIVFGSSAFASNPYMAEGRGSGLQWVLFNSTLSWLRERPGNIGLEPKKRNIFVLNVNDDVIQRMRYLPATILMVGIVGLGTGVWLVRRR